MFLWNSLAFLMIQQMLAIWSLVPLPFLNPTWTSGSSWFTYCWSLGWRILSITSAWDECNCAVVWAFFGIALLWDWNGSWPFPVLWPLLFSKFAGILSAAFQQHHLLGVEIVFRSFSFRESMPLMCFILGLLCLCLIGDYDANARYSFGALCVSGRNVFCRYLQFWKEKASHISRARHLLKESITKITRCHIIF